MNPNTPGKIIATFFGWSNTGKTTFIENALKALVRRGVPCAALKCTRHPGSFQVPGKDSTRFFRTGAESAMMGGSETVLALHSPETLDRAFLDRLFPEARVVLVEGGKVEGALRVLAAGGSRTEADLKLPLESVDVLVTGCGKLEDLARKKGIQCVAPDGIDTFLALLEERHGT